MDDLEMESREKFYGKMMWIVNGEKFNKNFLILGKLPDPDSEIAKQLVFRQPSSDAWYVKERYRKNCPRIMIDETILVNWVDFFIRDENPGYEEWMKHKKGFSPLVGFVDFERAQNIIIEEILPNYVGHHTYLWKNSRKVWFASTKPVFIDFGGEELWRLMQYGSQGFPCVRKIYKKTLIEKNGGTYPNPAS